MNPPATDPDLPADPRERIDVRIDAILRRIDPREGDLGTIARRHAARELLRLAREAVALDAQREVETARLLLNAATEKQRADERVIRIQQHALHYYGDAQNWQGGCAVHVNAFDVDDVSFDEGEHAREALRSVAWAFPR